MPQIIDLSVPLEDQAVSEPFPASIRYIDHAEGGRQMEALFGVRREDLVYSDGNGWAIEEISAITHTGTHVDAPYHYGATSGGRPALRIDELPLDWFYAPGVVLDIRDLAAGELVTPEHLQKRLDGIGHRLAAHQIVLLQTGCDKKIDSPEYFQQPGLGREAVLWLTEQGVRVIGIDAYTLDRPFAAMKADYEQDGDGRAIWPAHFAGLSAAYCQIEKLANLDQLPAASGFTLSCLPVKIARASAGWCRAVAIFED
jgi:kynurenine formamidase